MQSRKLLHWALYFVCMTASILFTSDGVIYLYFAFKQSNWRSGGIAAAFFLAAWLLLKAARSQRRTTQPV
jgi:hypothetical protein